MASNPGDGGSGAGGNGGGGGSGGGELPSMDKYKRLIQEYTKIKSQNTVLKRAVVQEQEAVRVLERQCQDKEQVLRAQLEEIDTLAFNNHRLTRRVEQLIADNEDKKKGEGGGWGWGGGGKKLTQAHEALSLAEEQLALKIAENEQVHIMMFEQRQAHDAEMEMMAAHISDLEEALVSTQDRAAAAEREAEELNAIREELKLQLGAAEADVAALEVESAERVAALSERVASLTDALQEAQARIRRRIPFDDTTHAPFSRYNAPSFDRSTSLKRNVVLDEGLALCRRLMAAMDDYQSSFSWRLRLEADRDGADPALGGVNDQVIAFLPRQSALLESLFAAYRGLVTRLRGGGRGGSQTASPEAVSGMEDAVRAVAQFYKKMLPYHLTRARLLQAGLERSSPEAKIHAALSAVRTRVVAALSNVADAVGASSVDDVPSEGDALAVALTETADAFAALHHETARLIRSDQSASKATNDQQTADSAFLEALRNVSSVVGAIAAAAARYTAVVRETTSEAGSGSGDSARAKETGAMRARGASFMARLRYTPGESLSFAEGLRLAAEVEEVKAEKEHLVDEVSALQTALAEAEAATASAQASNDALERLVSVLQGQLEGAQTEAAAAAAPAVASDASLNPPDIAVLDPSSGDEAIETPKLQASLEAARSQLASLEDELAATKRELDEARSAVASLSAVEATGGGDVGGHDGEISAAMRDTGLLDGAGDATPPRAGVAQRALSASGGPIDRPKSPSPAEMFRQRTAGGDLGGYAMAVVDLETGIQASGLAVDNADLRDREVKLKKHYEVKIAHLESKLEAADRSSSDWHRSYLATTLELEAAQAQLAALERSSASVDAELHQVTSDTETMRRNYDDQLNTFTEHIVKLNGTISNLEEDMSAMKNASVLCSVCRKWNTVGWLMVNGDNGRVCAHGNHASSYNFA